MRDLGLKPAPLGMDRERKRRARRWVWGCTGGCFGIILLMALIVWAGARYLLQPMPLPPPQTFLSPQTSAFLVARVDPDDPLAALTAERLFPDERMAETLLDLFAPVQCVVVLEPGEPEGVVHGGMAASVNKAWRLLPYMVKRMIGKPFSRQDGAEVTSLDATSHLGICRNTALSADTDELLKRWIGRLNAGARAEGGPAGIEVSAALKRAYDRLDADLPLLFVCLNRHGELASLAGLIADEDARQVIRQTGLTGEGVVSLSGQLRPVDPRSAEVTFLIDCGDRADAEAMADRLRAAVRQLGRKWSLRATTIEVQPPGVVVVKGRLDDVPGTVAGLVEGLYRRVQGGAPTAPHPGRVPAHGPTISK